MSRSHYLRTIAPDDMPRTVTSAASYGRVVTETLLPTVAPSAGAVTVVVGDVVSPAGGFDTCTVMVVDEPTLPAGQRLVFCSGQLGITSDKQVPPDCAGQARWISTTPPPTHHSAAHSTNATSNPCSWRDTRSAARCSHQALSAPDTAIITVPI